MRAIVVWAALLSSLPAAAEEIRVEVRRSVAAALVAGAADVRQGPDGQASPAGDRLLAIRGEGGRLLLGDKVVNAPLAIRPGDAPLSLDGRRMPGRLEVWAEPSGLVVVNVLDLEDYVAAVVASEMPASWPAAALEAQAIAARTFAMAQKIAIGAGARAHLGSTVLDQVYAGAAGKGARAAAQATHGEVLTFGAMPIQAFFSSSCGGSGESGEAAFNLPAGATPYLPGGDDGDADAAASSARWTRTVPLANLSAALQRAGRASAKVRAIEIVDRTPSGRARTVRIKAGKRAIDLPAAELRQLIGYRELPSLLFDVKLRPGSGGPSAVAIFTGRGSGHGAGLCQWGARGRAARGERRAEILSHYYPGAEVRRMY